MRTPPAKKTSTLARKGSATRVVRRKAAEVEDDDDTMVKKMVKVRDLEEGGGILIELLVCPTAQNTTC